MTTVLLVALSILAILALIALTAVVAGMFGAALDAHLAAYRAHLDGTRKDTR